MRKTLLSILFLLLLAVPAIAQKPAPAAAPAQPSTALVKPSEVEDLKIENLKLKLSLYTQHKDVYKRQESPHRLQNGRKQAGKKKAAAKNENIPAANNAENLYSETPTNTQHFDVGYPQKSPPVSYTHLDVYKRQAHTEMLFQDFYSFIALRLRWLLAFLPAQQPMIDGVFTASGLNCKSNHFGSLPLLRVRIEVPACAYVLCLLCVGASIGLDVVEQATNTRSLARLRLRIGDVLNDHGWRFAR